MARLVESSATEKRLAEARAFVSDRASRGDVTIVAATRGAADDLARSIARTAGATIGIHRFSLTQLAARLAAPIVAADGHTPATSLASEAVAARAAFEANRDRALSYFGPVAQTPGFPRALLRTLQELRLAQVPSASLAALPFGGEDLAALLEKFEEQFKAASSTDRATLFRVATEAARDTALTNLAAAPLLLLDVPLDSRIEFEFVRALITASPDVLITVPFGDLKALDRLKGVGLVPVVLKPEGDTDLDSLRLNLFAGKQLPLREPRGDVRFFSAPGEGRECVEIARRILDEVRRGVPFDEIAVFVRSPERYAGLIEHAFRRARSSDARDAENRGIPAWFDRGTRRPHPAGRAFLAILACACEKLSARRFAEYLSLAQVPQLDGSRPEFSFVVPDDEVLVGLREPEHVSTSARRTSARRTSHVAHRT